jgi:PAS domain S-box-containing protein
MKFSLKTKILFSICLVILFVGLSASVVVFLESERMMVNIKRESITKLHNELARNVGYVFDSSSALAKSITRRDEVTQYFRLQNNSTREAQLTELLDNNIMDRPEYLAIYVLDKKGICVSSTDRRFVGQNYSFRQYFIQAIKGKAYTDVVLGKTSNELGYYFSHPVRSEDKGILGVVVLKLQPNVIKDRLNNNELAKAGHMMFVDSNGVILHSSRPNRYLRSLGSLNTQEINKLKSEQKFLDVPIQPIQYESIQTLIRDYAKPVTVDYFNKSDGEIEIIGVNQISNYPFFTISEIDIDYLIDTAFKLAGLLSISVFVAAALAAFIIVIITRQILSPLKKIINYTNVVSKGDFEKSIEIKTGDEFEVLANTLNLMTTHIKGLYDSLEDKIREQTKELTDEVKQLEEAHSQTKILLTEVATEKEMVEKQRQDLQKYQLAVENVSDHIVITDPEGIILYANKAVEGITGFPRAEILGTKAGVLWGRLMPYDLYKQLWDEIKINKRSYIGEFNNKRKNGELYIAEARVSPILDSNNDVIFFVGIERDITKMREVDRMKSEFISLASHQLRTPLSAMKWFLEMLMAGDIGTLTPEQKEIINNINDSNERMIELVNTLLDVSRIESGKLIIDPKPTDLRMLLNGLLSELEPQLKIKNQVISVDLPQDLPDLLLDPKLIRQVYMNYLTNAIKYSPPDTTITLKILWTEKEMVSEVRDEGHGITLSEQDRIFQKFFRASNSGKRDTDGNGLGLYLVKSIVESSGGKVWFESVEGKGTSFYFSIPVIK